MRRDGMIIDLTTYDGMTIEEITDDTICAVLGVLHE